MAMGAARHQALPSRRPPTQAGHVGLGRRFVDEDEPAGGELTLPRSPLLPRDRDIGPVLFGCMESLFLYVSPKASRA
jgi:hypothetical protein